MITKFFSKLRNYLIGLNAIQVQFDILQQKLDQIIESIRTLEVYIEQINGRLNNIDVPPFESDVPTHSIDSLRAPREPCELKINEALSSPLQGT